MGKINSNEITLMDNEPKKLAGERPFSDLFFSVVTHDLKGPLTIIQMVAQDLETNWQKMDEQERFGYIVELNKGLGKTTGFIKDFLAWMRLFAHANSLPPTTTFKVDTLLKQVSEFASLGAKRKNLELKVEYNSNLNLISIYPFVEIVMRNIVENACKFTKTGSVHIYALENENSISIFCRDTGIGIDSYTLGAILNGKSMLIGSGESFRLGYSFVFELLNHLGAKIFIDSTLGEGTTVELRFPNL